MITIAGGILLALALICGFWYGFCAYTGAPTALRRAMGVVIMVAIALFVLFGVL
jgi:hypothetical protein